MRTLLNMLIPDQNLNGGGVVSVARVVQLGAIADDHEHIHGGLEFNVFSGVRNPIFKGELSIWGYRDIHEEVDIAGDVSLVESAIPELNAFEKAIAAGVHVPLGDIVTDHVAFGGASATEGVMTAAGICGDREKEVTVGRNKLGTDGEIDIALFANRVLRAITVSVVMRVIEDGVNSLVALEVYDTYRLARLDLVDERISRFYNEAVQGSLDFKGAWLESVDVHVFRPRGKLKEV
jgi:hypothetical protein